MKKNFKKALAVFVLTIAVISTAGIIISHFEQTKEAVQVVSERVLVPGGQSVGIQMDVKGVLVVGLEEIETETDIVSPGYAAGVQIGDIIISVNGQKVYYAEDVTEAVNKAMSEDVKKPLELKVLRKEEELTLNVAPVKDNETEEYKIGIWVKEKIAGIGTLTFYDPRTNVFAIHIERIINIYKFINFSNIFEKKANIFSYNHFSRKSYIIVLYDVRSIDFLPRLIQFLFASFDV